MPEVSRGLRCFNVFECLPSNLAPSSKALKRLLPAKIRCREASECLVYARLAFEQAFE
jgi:hypothetical protein